ncbi:MAG: hypothetical protein D6743_12235 [Calditrichaeota bacterium]|nr:MAG: hypothetical protein D6743_12235 [Calditrichota bacterium]
MDDEHRQNVPQGTDAKRASQKLPIADIISLETVVNLLVDKGICTLEELYEEEWKRRRHLDGSKGQAYVNVGRDGRESGNMRSHSDRQDWLKKKMIKRRWSRRLGTWLFGWQWKKVKSEPKTGHIEKV